MGYIDGPLLTLIWVEGYFPHNPTSLSRFFWKQLRAKFGSGVLRFNCMWYDQFICHQSYTTITNFNYERETFSVVFQTTSSYFIYQNLLYEDYQFYSIQSFKNNTAIISQPKKYPNNRTISFHQSIYKKIIIIFPQEKTPIIGISVYPRKQIPHGVPINKNHI